MIVRSILFVCLVCVAALAPTLFFVLCACAYALRYAAYELIVLCTCIDALYGYGHPIFVPYYVIFAIVLVVSLEWVKPHISVYNQ